MSDFFDSQASNYMVQIAVKVSKIEKRITDNIDSESLVELYNSIQHGTQIIEKCMEDIETKKIKKGVSDE
ncbi:hypothetical protein [Sulfurimonas sp.]|uniref:hypothetical protein n=1 Tax=Sulfurimonas sp. TaxID=2022749 RepID=UPI0025F147E3|nr:hypothetical protein [Sulfurimonas sp.]